MNQLLRSVTVGDEIYHCRIWQQKPCRAVLMCLTQNAGLWMKGKALMLIFCKSHWVVKIQSRYCFRTPCFSEFISELSFIFKPQHKPGSDRIKGQTLLSSVRLKKHNKKRNIHYDCQHKSESEKSDVFVSLNMLTVSQNNNNNNKRVKRKRKKDWKCLCLWLFVYLKNLMFMRLKICFVENTVNMVFSYKVIHLTQNKC